MYPNRIGFGAFGGLVIECLEICHDDGSVAYVEFVVEGETMNYKALIAWLVPRHPTIAKLLKALGREKFLKSVLDWNPADSRTRGSFYRFLARRADFEGWDDQPEMEYY
jgi:hypothetical protein